MRSRRSSAPTRRWPELFAPGTTRTQLDEAAQEVVRRTEPGTVLPPHESLAAEVDRALDALVDGSG